jgi:hypothetical protein
VENNLIAIFSFKISLQILIIIFRVKKWCKICKKKARAERKEYFKMIDEEEYLKKIQMQNELFNKAMGGSDSNYFNNDYDDGLGHDDYLFHDHHEHQHPYGG